MIGHDHVERFPFRSTPSGVPVVGDRYLVARLLQVEFDNGGQGRIIFRNQNLFS